MKCNYSCSGTYNNNSTLKYIEINIIRKYK